MGITIKSKNNYADMGYFGFNRFREKVAKMANQEFGEHYAKLSSPEFVMMGFIEGNRKRYFEEYDKKTKKLIGENKILLLVADFCYQSDCEGEVDAKQSSVIYELIKDCDDDIVYGYLGRSDCATMATMKKIFEENTKVEWC